MRDHLKSNSLICFWLMILVLVLSASSVHAQQEQNPLPAVLEQFFSENAQAVSGAAAALIQDGEIVYEHYVGMADAEKGLAVNPDTVFEWGSATKLLVWTSVMQLWEQGKIDLDADVRMYLPDGFFTRRLDDSPVTMLNLMNHNAGWEEVLLDLFIPMGREVQPLEDVLRSTEPRQIYQTGRYTTYSNWGAALAGLIVERISGLSFAEYVHLNIFDSLGMDRTALLPDLSDNLWVQQQRLLVVGYASPTVRMPENQFQISLYPAGMATGTLADFARFAQALSGDGSGGSGLFKQQETLKTFFEPTSYYGSTAYGRNAHGFWVAEYANPVYLHPGNTASHSANLMVDPLERTALVVMTNQASEQIFNYDLPALVFGNVEGNLSTEGNSIDAAGYYQGTRTIFSRKFKLTSALSRMQVKLLPDQSIEMSQFGTKTVEQAVAPNIYWGDGFVTAIVQKPGEPLKIESAVSDSYQISGWKYWSEMALLILWAAAALYSLIRLVLAPIGWIGMKRGHPKMAAIGATSRQFFIYLAAFLSIVLLVILAASAMSFQPADVVQVVVAGFLVLLIVLVLLLVWQALSWLREKKSPSLKEVSVCLIGLIVVFNLIFWQTFRW